jgi:hypothetical protein
MENRWNVEDSFGGDPTENFQIETGKFIQEFK